MDTSRLLIVLAQAGSFISVFAAIAAGIVMATVQKRFGTGILASGFRSIALGVFFIAGGITLDSFQNYLPLLSPSVTNVLLILKELLFVIGTYVIVIGSKRTGDKLESLTK